MKYSVRYLYYMYACQEKCQYITEVARILLRGGKTNRQILSTAGFWITHKRGMYLRCVKSISSRLTSTLELRVNVPIVLTLLRLRENKNACCFPQTLMFPSGSQLFLRWPVCRLLCLRLDKLSMVHSQLYLVNKWST